MRPSEAYTRNGIDNSQTLMAQRIFNEMLDEGRGNTGYRHRRSTVLLIRASIISSKYSLMNTFFMVRLPAISFM